MTDDEWMEFALAEARGAEAHSDVPVGAIVVLDNEVIGRGHNERELRQDPTAHAEVLALQDAARHVGSWRLETARLTVLIPRASLSCTQVTRMNSTP